MTREQCNGRLLLQKLYIHPRILILFPAYVQFILPSQKILLKEGFFIMKGVPK